MNLKKTLRNVLPADSVGLMKSILLRYQSFIQKGSGIYCPICNRSFKKFIHFGINTINELHCPGCGSISRDRLLWLYFSDILHLSGSKLSFLEIAPNKIFSKKLSNSSNIDYLSGDISSPSAMMKFDVMSIPLDDDKFDVILCSHVLEHVENDLTALKEFRRILKTDGVLLILSPIDFSRETTYEDSMITSPTERLKHFGQEDHLRMYGNDLAARITGCGFSVKTYSRNQLSIANDFDRLGLSKEDLIFECKKI